MTLELRRGVKVSGRVVDESGQGAVYASVSGRGANRDSGGRADKDGFFDFLCEPGEIRLQAKSTTRDKVSESLLVEAAPGEEITGIELVVVPLDVVIEGQVTDPARKPVAGVSVDVYDGAGKSLGGAGTDPDGRYRIVNVPPGSYRVSAGQPSWTAPTTSTAWHPGCGK